MTGESDIGPSGRRTKRDVRLDFFRGLGMFIIFIAHVPKNPWNNWIPARFGFSDATEIFVFCSGMASAIAFASVFDRAGFGMGVARVLHRCWQVYWCHIGLFLSAVAMMVAADQIFGTGEQFANSLNLTAFIGEHTAAAILGLFTLTYVPHLFDILPMYLVVLTFIPMMMAASRVSPLAPLVLSAAVWITAWYAAINFPSTPWNQETWFFDPLCWQAVFFTGFAFIRGWLPPPPVDRRLVAVASIIALVAIPFAHPWGAAVIPDQFAIPHAWIDKTTFGPLRYVHFLALAYLAYAAAGEKGANLSGPLVSICCKVGQQSLAVFVAGILFSLAGGIALTINGYTPPMVLLVNLAGFAGLITVAYVVAWFKSKPWSARQQPSSTGQRTLADARPAAE